MIAGVRTVTSVGGAAVALPGQRLPGQGEGSVGSRPIDWGIDDTIAAIASAPGGAVRGIVRVSGPQARQCLQPCFRPRMDLDLTAMQSPTSVAGDVQLAEPLGLLPVDLLWWPTRRSYTRQPTAELHTFGSPPLLDALLQTLCQCGARLAQPGEFTLRAFLSGRIDLTQAEAVLGVIDAQDTSTLHTALQQLAGGLAGPLAQLRSTLLDLLADVEAGLDFADEDISFVTPDQLASRLTVSIDMVRQIAAQISSRGVTTHLPRVVLRGWPNVGKSSLLNALVGEAGALVSSQAGTTRDYVTLPFQWQGVEGLLIDTAGLELGGQLDPLALAAQEAAREQQQQADLELLCFDATRPLHEQEQRLLEQETTASRLVVWTKMDASTGRFPAGAGSLVTSSQTGQGIGQLRSAIGRHLQAARTAPDCVVASTAHRCQQSLTEAAQHLAHAHELVDQPPTDELIAWELREALDRLGQVVGAVYTDDILDRVFSRFCIGK